MGGRDGLSVEVCEPVTRLLILSGDDAALFTVQGVGYG